MTSVLQPDQVLQVLQSAVSVLIDDDELDDDDAAEVAAIFDVDGDAGDNMTMMTAIIMLMFSCCS